MEVVHLATITSVTFEEGSACTTIDSYAFLGTRLSELLIPNSVTTIGDRIVNGSTPLSKIVVPEKLILWSHSRKYNDYIHSDTIVWNAIAYPKECYAFDYGDDREYNTTTKRFIFGEKVTLIPDRLCFHMKELKEITIPNAVTTIGARAFEGCTGLKTITIGNGVTSINYDAFKYCTAKVYIKAVEPPTVTGDPFYGCSVIYVPSASVDKYRTAWSDFATKIVGYDFE